MRYAGALAVVLGLLVMGWGGATLAALVKGGYSDLTLRLAYTVLYDRMLFDAAVQDAVRGIPNDAWVEKRIADEHDVWIRGELLPVLREYFRRAPWRCDSFPDDYRELFCGKKT